MRSNKYEIPIRLGKPRTTRDLELNNSQEESSAPRVSEAYRLKQAFQFEYRYAESRFLNKASEYAPYGKYRGEVAWEEIIGKLRSQGINDPIEYVRVLFHWMSGQMVFPNGMIAERREWTTETGEAKVKETRSFLPIRPAKLATPAMVKKYRHALKDGRSCAAVELFSSRQRTRTSVVRDCRYSEWSVSQAIRHLLISRFESHSVLFRFALAYQMIQEPPGSTEQRSTNQRFRDLSKDFEKPACLQYLGNVEGYRQWSKWLPKNFEQRARAVYQALIEGSDAESDRQQ